MGSRRCSLPIWHWHDSCSNVQCKKTCYSNWQNRFKYWPMSNRRRHQIVLIIGNIQPTDLFLLDPPFQAFWTFNYLYKYIIWGYYDECSFFIHVIGTMPVTVMTLHRHVNHNYRLFFFSTKYIFKIPEPDMMINLSTSMMLYVIYVC